MVQATESQSLVTAPQATAGSVVAPSRPGRITPGGLGPGKDTLLSTPP